MVPAPGSGEGPGGAHQHHHPQCFLIFVLLLSSRDTIPSLSLKYRTALVRVGFKGRKKRQNLNLSYKNKLRAIGF